MLSYVQFINKFGTVIPVLEHYTEYLKYTKSYHLFIGFDDTFIKAFK